MPPLVDGIGQLAYNQLDRSNGIVISGDEDVAEIGVTVGI